MLSAVPNPHRSTAFGLADDGGVVSVDVPRAVAHLLSDRWPPEGLTRDDVAERDPVLRLAIDVDFVSGEVAATVDGEPSPGGWERVESELALFAADRRSGWVAIHAAVIASGGRILLVPGASGVGKSTLCVAAARHGADVLSDEYALVDPRTGAVRGWRRPVRMRTPHGIQRIDLVVDSAPLPVGLIAVVTHSTTIGSAWAPLAAADGAMALMANTVCAQSRPDESLDAALVLARNVPAVGGTRGDADAAIADLLAEMGAWA